MANYEINEEQEVLIKAMRMIETGDPVHADIYNALFSALLNNDVFLEKLANKMVQQAMVSHVMDSTNSNMVLGADQGPVITKLIDKVQEQVTVLNTNQQNFLKYNGTFYGDANTVDQSGYWQLVERNGSNLPDSTESHYGTFINFITQYPLQIVALAYFDTHVVYIRIKRDNTWSSWKEI